MKEPNMILILRHGEDGAEPIAVINADEASPERVDEVITDTFSEWVCPPQEGFKLIRSEDDDSFINIQHESGYIDYDGDGTFEVKEVPVK